MRWLDPLQARFWGMARSARHRQGEGSDKLNRPALAGSEGDPLMALQKAKGPAEGAASPSHGPNNPREENAVNRQQDNTAGARTPAGPDAIIDAVNRLESPLCDAVNMARVVSQLIEHVNYEEVLGQRCLVIQHNSAEALTFAIYQTQALFEAAHLAWDDANTFAFSQRRAS
ncbi:hypothetical protein GTW51_18935 [Aurantimonas aggregata]|uniref:Uncharacterized protein n=1 Tax=Aurantimonas aggregata TaxID=2047720 RepID=A0A6L9MLJ8_9HYPH|nr:hypothetical protein [Aurantimonas aggregata]NDV88774.1 hypothetical protein [Aurantimonas aggregata]